MRLAINNDICKWFGSQFASKIERVASYSLVEKFIEKAHPDWSATPNTEKIAAEFARVLKGLTTSQFSFLLCHTGFIPEVYLADSSQETLFSKLVEVIVGEWAKRIGFDQTKLPTAKSSTEDVTIEDKNHVIVCDAKTFRLGRSQKAPNVKDALKQGDIAKWLSAYPQNKRLGGLVTFPSQHDWTGGSDFYQYLTDKSSPIAMIFYEHMSFMLLAGHSKERIVHYFQSHGGYFARPLSKSDGNRAKYFKILEENLIKTPASSWECFYTVADYVIRERVSHAIDDLDKFIADGRKSITKDVEKMDEASLRRKLIEVTVNHRFEHLLRQIANIRKFRDVLD